MTWDNDGTEVEFVGGCPEAHTIWMKSAETLLEPGEAICKQVFSIVKSHPKWRRYTENTVLNDFHLLRCNAKHFNTCPYPGEFTPLVLGVADVNTVLGDALAMGGHCSLCPDDQHDQGAGLVTSVYLEGTVYMRALDTEKSGFEVMDVLMLVTLPHTDMAAVTGIRGPRTEMFSIGMPEFWETDARRSEAEVTDVLMLVTLPRPCVGDVTGIGGPRTEMIITRMPEVGETDARRPEAEVMDVLMLVTTPLSSRGEVNIIRGPWAGMINARRSEMEGRELIENAGKWPRMSVPNSKC